MKSIVINRARWLRNSPRANPIWQGYLPIHGEGECHCFVGFFPPYGLRDFQAGSVNDHPFLNGIKTVRRQESRLKAIARRLGYAVKFVGRGYPKGCAK